MDADMDVAWREDGVDTFDGICKTEELKREVQDGDSEGRHGPGKGDEETGEPKEGKEDETIELWTESRIEPIIEPRIEPIIEPIIEPRIEPSTETRIEPTTEPRIEHWIRIAPINRGPMPNPYPLPAFKPLLVGKIKSFGRTIDCDTRKEIADELRDDMLLYNSYAYPPSWERERVARRLVEEYPQLADVTEGGFRDSNRCHTTWMVEITRSFARWRRKHGQTDATLMKHREVLNIQLNRRPALGKSREYNPNTKAERKLKHLIPRCIGTEVVLEPTEIQARFQLALLEKWRAYPHDKNAIIDLLDRTATIRRQQFTDGNSSLKQSLDQYPPLRTVMHIRDDMIRFFHINVYQKLKDFFTMDKCIKNVDVVLQSTKTPTPIINSFSLVSDARKNQNVVRDTVLAALPSLAGRDYTKSWFTIGKSPSCKAPIVRIDCGSQAFFDHRQATYTICADDVCIALPGGGEYTFTDALATGLSIFYLCDMKIPVNACASWRFLAEEVCGLPISGLPKNGGQLTLKNYFF